MANSRMASPNLKANAVRLHDSRDLTLFWKFQKPLCSNCASGHHFLVTCIADLGFSARCWIPLLLVLKRCQKALWVSVVQFAKFSQVILCPLRKIEQLRRLRPVLSCGCPARSAVAAVRRVHPVHPAGAPTGCGRGRGCAVPSLGGAVVSSETLQALCAACSSLLAQYKPIFSWHVRQIDNLATNTEYLNVDQIWPISRFKINRSSKALTKLPETSRASRASHPSRALQLSPRARCPTGPRPARPVRPLPPSAFGRRRLLATQFSHVSPPSPSAPSVYQVLKFEKDWNKWQESTVDRDCNPHCPAPASADRASTCRSAVWTFR